MIESIAEIKDILEVLFKVLGIAVTIMYLLFAVVITKQVSSMKKVLLTDKQGLLNLVSYIQLIIAFFLLGFSLFIL